MIHGLLLLAKRLLSVACSTRAQPLAQDMPCFVATYPRTCYGPATVDALALAMKRKEKTAPFGVDLMRSQVLYRAAQVLWPRLISAAQGIQVDEPSRGSLGSLASPALDRRPGSVDPVQRHQLMAAFQAAAQRSSDQVCAGHCIFVCLLWASSTFWSSLHQQIRVESYRLSKIAATVESSRDGF